MVSGRRPSTWSGRPPASCGDHDVHLAGFLHVTDDGPAAGLVHAPVDQADKHYITGKLTALMRESW